LKQKLDEIRDASLSQIIKVVQVHLRKSLSTVDKDLLEINPLDAAKAIEIAKWQLNRNLWKKIFPGDLALYFDDATNIIGRNWSSKVDETAEKVPRSSSQIIETPVQRTLPQTYDEHYLHQDHIQEPIVEETMDTWELITNTRRKRKTSSPATTHTVTPP